MKNLFFDLRGRSLHAMVVDGATVTYAKRFEQFSRDDEEQVNRVLAEIKRDAGMKVDRVHALIPEADVSVQKQVIPHMSPADADKVLQRKLHKATVGEAPLFSALPAESSGEKQAYIVETVERDALKKSLAFLRDRGISLKTATTALQANVRLMASMGDDPSRICGLIDIGDDLVEVLVLANGRLAFHTRVELPALDLPHELQSGKSMDRIQRVRVYQVSEAIFNALADYRKDVPDEPLQVIRLAGTSFALAGVLDALKDSADAEVRLLNSVSLDDGTGYFFSTLHGYALSVADNSTRNFLPRDMSRRPLPVLSGQALVALLVLYALFLGGLVLFTELKYGNVRTRLLALQTPVSGVEEADIYRKNGATLRGLLHGSVDMTGILGFLADRTPDGVSIDSLSFSRKSAAAPALDIDFIAPAGPGIAEHRLLTKIVSMLDQTGDIKRFGQPVITIEKQNKERWLHCKVHCEVALHD